MASLWGCGGGRPHSVDTRQRGDTSPVYTQALGRPGSLAGMSHHIYRVGDTHEAGIGDGDSGSKCLWRGWDEGFPLLVCWRSEIRLERERQQVSVCPVYFLCQLPGEDIHPHPLLTSLRHGALQTSSTACLHSKMVHSIHDPLT